MKTNYRSLINWLIDGLALVGFLISFSLDITGLALHEWLGIAVGAVCLLHLVLHWDWVKKVTRKFFTGVSWRSRLNYLIDGFLMSGFTVILFTGLVISDWLNLALTYYDVWRSVHVFVSVATLLLLVLKIALHARWIVTTFKRMLPTKPATELAPQGVRLQPAPEGMNRRQFLVLMGVVGSAASLAAGGVLHKELFELNEPLADLSVPDLPVASTVIQEPIVDILPTATPQNVEQPTATITQGVVEPMAVPPTATAVVTNPLAAVSSSESCTVRCRKGCSFPGRCRRYVDSNGNSKCDLGECL